MHKMISRKVGMTLVELIVVVAIIAILTMIAFPNYSKFQQRARRLDARAALEKIATMQERFYVTSFTYTAELTRLGFAGNQSESGHYVLDIPAADAQGFQAIAVPAPGSSQANDTECLQFTIDHQSVRLAVPDPNGDCW